MTWLLLILLCLAPLVRGTSTNSTGSICPLPGSEGITRSIGTILESCALTLSICVWRTLHPDVPKPEQKWYDLKGLPSRTGFVLLSYFAPEMIVVKASEEWCRAHRKVRQFRDQGYQWSMTHSYFAQMGGFAYRDENGSLRIINSVKFLELCKAGKVSDPLITAKEIKDKSKSDTIGKAIFAILLFWFTLQVVVRGSNGLAITLVELDTVCMAVLAVVYLFFWWHKPLRPECPHVFRYAGENKVYSVTELSNAWKSEPSGLQTLISRFICMGNVQLVSDEEKASQITTDLDSKPGSLVAMVEKTEPWIAGACSLFVAWAIIGAVHLMAWDFEFPTAPERIMWRGASLILAMSPLVMVLLWGIQLMSGFACNNPEDVLMFCVLVVGTLFRAQLVVLMLASLRNLPCSAYETVSWTLYIPHL